MFSSAPRKVVFTPELAQDESARDSQVSEALTKMFGSARPTVFGKRVTPQTELDWGVLNQYKDTLWNGPTKTSLSQMLYARRVPLSVRELAQHLARPHDGKLLVGDVRTMMMLIQKSMAMQGRDSWCRVINKANNPVVGIQADSLRAFGLDAHLIVHNDTLQRVINQDGSLNPKSLTSIKGRLTQAIKEKSVEAGGRILLGDLADILAQHSQASANTPRWYMEQDALRTLSKIQLTENMLADRYNAAAPQEAHDRAEAVGRSQGAWNRRDMAWFAVKIGLWAGALAAAVFVPVVGGLLVGAMAVYSFLGLKMTVAMQALPHLFPGAMKRVTPTELGETRSRPFEISWLKLLPPVLTAGKVNVERDNVIACHIDNGSWYICEQKGQKQTWHNMGAFSWDHEADSAALPRALKQLMRDSLRQEVLTKGVLVLLPTAPIAGENGQVIARESVTGGFLANPKKGVAHLYLVTGAAGQQIRHDMGPVQQTGILAPLSQFLEEQ